MRKTQENGGDAKSRPPDAAQPEAGQEASTPDPQVEAPPQPSEPAAAPEDTTDYKDRWLRAEADLQNFRRRARREIEDSRRAAEEAVLLDLVALLDDLERAIESARGSGADAAWTEGVRLVLQKGRDYLERLGVRAVDPLGKPFDPTLHEAVLEADAPEGAAPGEVIQVIHKGYARGSRALRAARVVVARPPEES